MSSLGFSLSTDVNIRTLFTAKTIPINILAIKIPNPEKTITEMPNNIDTVPIPTRNLLDQFSFFCMVRKLLVIRDTPKIINAIPSSSVMIIVELVENTNANNATTITPTPKPIVEICAFFSATVPVIIFSDPANNKPNEIRMINGKPPIKGCKRISTEKKIIIIPKVSWSGRNQGNPSTISN